AIGRRRGGRWRRRIVVWWVDWRHGIDGGHGVGVGELVRGLADLLIEARDHRVDVGPEGIPVGRAGVLVLVQAALDLVGLVVQVVDGVGEVGADVLAGAAGPGAQRIDLALGVIELPAPARHRLIVRVAPDIGAGGGGGRAGDRGGRAVGRRVGRLV